MFSVTITSKRDGRADELHRGVVDEHVLELDVAGTPRRGRDDDLAPQPRGLEHVRLVDARDPPARGAEGDAGDPLDLRDACRRRGRSRCRACASSRRSRCRRSARARPAGRCRRCAPRAAGSRRRAPSIARTGRRLANRPSPLRSAEQALLGARLRGVGRVPLRARRPAPSSTASARAAGGEHLVGQRDAVRVDRGAAEEVLLDLEARDRAPRTSRPAAMHLGPMPSPGSVTIRVIEAAPYQQLSSLRIRPRRTHAKAAGAAISARDALPSRCSRSARAAQRRDRGPERQPVRPTIAGRSGLASRCVRRAASSASARAGGALVACAGDRPALQADSTAEPAPSRGESVSERLPRPASTSSAAGRNAFCSVLQAAITCPPVRLERVGSVPALAFAQSREATG